MSAPVEQGLRLRNRRPAAATADSEEFLTDLAHLNLFGAFGDPVAAMVPVDVFERHVSHVADAAAGLHRPVGGVAGEPVRSVVAHCDEVRDALPTCGRSPITFRNNLLAYRSLIRQGSPRRRQSGQSERVVRE